MSNNKTNKVIDLYTELIMEQGDDTLKKIINGGDFKAKLLAASGQKKLKKSKDPNSPKKPRTTWLLFCNDTRPKLKKANPELKMSEITSLMSPMWVDLQASTEPEDIATINGYKKIVEDERSIYNAAKANVEKSKPKKFSKNAYQLFMKEERTKPKPAGETFGETTKRISVEWAKLKEDDPGKIEELVNRVKQMKEEATSSASEAEEVSVSETEEASEPEAELTIESILEKMHNEDSEEEEEESKFKEWDNEYMIDDENLIYPKNDTSKAVGKVTDIEDATIDFFDTKPKAKPKPKTKAKPKAKPDEVPKQKRPKCKKKAT